MIQVVTAPSGLIRPVGVATVRPMFAAGPVITPAGGCPAVVNVRSTPVAVPNRLVAVMR